jgi:hypothetical protein
VIENTGPEAMLAVEADRLWQDHATPSSPGGTTS